MLHSLQNVQKGKSYIQQLYTVMVRPTCIIQTTAIWSFLNHKQEIFVKHVCPPRLPIWYTTLDWKMCILNGINPKINKGNLLQGLCVFIYVKLNVNILPFNSVLLAFFSPLIFLVGGVSFLFNCCIQLM